MQFVQLIEYTTSKHDEVQKLMDQWMAATEGKRTATSSITGRDRDRSNTYIEIVEFPSYEDAMKNNQLPETSDFADRVEKLCDGPATFRNLDVIREDSL